MWVLSEETRLFKRNASNNSSFNKERDSEHSRILAACSWHYAAVLRRQNALGKISPKHPLGYIPTRETSRAA
jgi:hypothetical protein